MNGAWLLVGLLALAYFGSVAGSKGRFQSLAAHSGAVYLVLGFVLGPAVVGALERGAVEDFRVVTQVGGSWLALVAGLGSESKARRAWGHATLGVALTALVALGVAASAWFALAEFYSIAGLDRALLAGGAGLLFSASAPPLGAHDPEGSHGADSPPNPLTLSVVAVARATPLVSAVSLAALFACAPEHGLLGFPSGLRVIVTLAVGAVLGVIAALLLGRELRQSESWGLLLGVSLLGGGAALRVGLSGVAVSFMLGLTISAASQHRNDIRALVAPTEKAVLLPVAVLAGAALDLSVWSVSLAFLFLAVRLLLDVVRGNVLRWLLPETRSAGPLFGLSLAMPGAVTLAAGLELHQGLPHGLGAPLLLFAVVSTVAGDVVSSLQARRSLPRIVATSAESLAPDATPERVST